MSGTPVSSPGIEQPAPERLDAAQRLLTSLGALDRDTGRITPLGKQMLGLPVHPRLARLLIAAGARGPARAGGRAGGLALGEGHGGTGHGGPDPARPAAGRPPSAASPTSSRGSTGCAEAESARFSPSLRSRGIDPAAARQVARVRDELVRLAARSAQPRPFSRDRRTKSRCSSG